MSHLTCEIVGLFNTGLYSAMQESTLESVKISVYSSNNCFLFKRLEWIIDISNIRYNLCKDVPNLISSWT